jgi:hypothetical protein
VSGRQVPSGHKALRGAPAVHYCRLLTRDIPFQKPFKATHKSRIAR